MKANELEYVVMGCCNEHRRAVVNVEDGTQAIVTDNGDGTYAVVRLRDGRMVAGSEKTIGAGDDI